MGERAWKTIAITHVMVLISSVINVELIIIELRRVPGVRVYMAADRTAHGRLMWEEKLESCLFLLQKNLYQMQRGH